MNKILIIGNGIAGVTAARHIRKKSNDEITIVSSESKYFFSRTALMYVFMGHMEFKHIQPYEDWFWEKNKIDLVFDHATGLDTSLKKVNLRSGKSLTYDQLILALGSRSRDLRLAGKELKGVQALYSKQDLELMESNTRDITDAVVIGGGLIGIEMAEMLHSRGIHVTMVVRESSYWNAILPEEESAMINRHIISRGIDLKLSCHVETIKGGSRVENVITDKGELIPCQFVGVTVGVEPNIGLADGTSILTNQGILVNEYLQTSVPDVYAIGDCAEIERPGRERRAIEPVWYTGRMMGETVAEHICGQDSAYEPGIWFNSAKFFDLEYQTYGTVPTGEREGLSSFYWQDPDRERCLRIVYKIASDEVVGFNTLGLRLRHEVCDKWISEQRSLAFVMQNLNDLNFDPEFYRKFDKDIVTTYKQTR
jgi:NAD(P)H-nitrite reductase large subunit